MTTEQATEKLGQIWMLGGISDAAMALNRVIAHSSDWNWDAANAAMRDAYAVLGATAPDVPVNAIHNGSHPVQIAADKFWAKK